MGFDWRDIETKTTEAGTYQAQSPQLQSQGPTGPDQDVQQQITQKPTSWITIELKDEEGNAVPMEPYQIKLPDGSVKEGMLDIDGRAHLVGIDPGSCDVSFPKIDAKDWRRA